MIVNWRNTNKRVKEKEKGNREEVKRGSEEIIREMNEKRKIERGRQEERLTNRIKNAKDEEGRQMQKISE